MSLRNRIVLLMVLAALAILAGCGGNGSPTVVPPPTGGFSNSHLNGVYVFSVTGTDANGYFVTMAGTFSANGSGGVTSGVIDLNDTNPSVGPVLSQAVTSGSYSVGADGRPNGLTGEMALQTANGPYLFDFVLSSSTHGLITEFDQFGSASGTFDLQANVGQGNVNGQSYAFNFSGTSGVNTVICGLSNGGGLFVIPFAAVGAFTLDANGNVSAGLEDFNNNCSSSGLTDQTITSGFVSLSTVPGTAQLTTTVGGTYNFDVFPVDATHLKFFEVDSLPVAGGDAFTQTSSFPSGNNVFSMAGFDNFVGGPFTAAGIIATDANGNVLTNTVEDINDAGTAFESGNVVGSNITGGYTALSGGRSVLSFTSGFVNGNGGNGCSNCQFAAYPSSGGLQLLEIDDGGITDGIAYPQIGSPTLASGQGYGLNLTGVNFSANAAEDDIAEFTNTSGAFAGIIDFNDQGSTLFAQKFTSTFTADSSVPGRGTVSPGSNSYFMTTYSIDTSTAVALSTDGNMVGIGSLVEQNANAKSNVKSNPVASHLAVLKARSGVKTGVKRQARFNRH